MSIEQLIEFFKWMTIINFGLFMFSFLVTAILRKMIIRIHAKMFGVEEAKVSEILYGLFGLYKIIFLVFCFVPYIVLAMI